ncbi:hypothetical protein BH23CHL2_BH23CHL2_33080 [soil metagenome]
MHASDLCKLYEYNCWMNDRILDAASRVTPEQFVAPTKLTPRNLQDNLVHILDVEWSWRERARGAPPEVWQADMEIPDNPDIDTLRARWQQESAIMRDYLDNLSDEELAAPSGLREERDLALWQILLHAINHGTLARVEVAVLLTRYGQSPGDLDYLDFADPVS